MNDGDAELARLLSLSRAYKASKALNLSAKLGIYTLLASCPNGMTWMEISKHMGWRCHTGFRGSADFLDLLVSVGTLQREGDGIDSRLAHSS